MKNTLLKTSYLIIILLCSCNTSYDIAKQNHESERDDLHKGLDLDSFVGLVTVSTDEDFYHVVNILYKHKIPNTFQSALGMYGITVPQDQKERAIEILKKDSKEYYFQ